MELKDWILITIPIACNGVILFIFQQFYLSRLKKVERKNTYKIDVLKEFLSNLQKFYELSRNLQHVDNERSAKEYTFAELWNPAAEMMQNLIVFADTHPITINNFRLEFDKCINKWQEISDDINISKELALKIADTVFEEKFGKDFIEKTQVTIEEIYGVYKVYRCPEVSALGGGGTVVISKKDGHIMSVIAGE